MGLITATVDLAELRRVAESEEPSFSADVVLTLLDRLSGVEAERDVALADRAEQAAAITAYMNALKQCAGERSQLWKLLESEKELHARRIIAIDKLGVALVDALAGYGFEGWE